MPDTLSAIYEYSDKLQINYSCYLGNEHFGYGEQICGNEGTIEVMNRQDLYFEPERTIRGVQAQADRRRRRSRRASQSTSTARQEFKEADGAINHFRNFIQAMLGKEQVIAPPPVGQQAAISGHMATLSFKNQKKVVWDDAANKYHFA